MNAFVVVLDYINEYPGVLLVGTLIAVAVLCFLTLFNIRAHWRTPSSLAEFYSCCGIKCPSLRWLVNQLHLEYLSVVSFMYRSGVLYFRLQDLV